MMSPDEAVAVIRNTKAFRYAKTDYDRYVLLVLTHAAAVFGARGYDGLTLQAKLDETLSADEGKKILAAGFERGAGIEQVSRTIVAIVDETLAGVDES
jgi:hypothetical protein